MAKSFIGSCASGSGLTTGPLLASPDGVKWLSAVPQEILQWANTNSFYGTCANSTYALASGATFTTGLPIPILRTIDGAKWDDVTTPSISQVSYNSLGCNESFAVAVGATGSSVFVILTSPDGSTWTQQTTPATVGSVAQFEFGNAPGMAVSVSSSLAIAVGHDTTHANGFIITSPTGVAWTRRASLANISLYGVWAGSPLNVAVGTNLTTHTVYITTSADGVTWAPQTPDPATGSGADLTGLVAVAGSGSLYVAVGTLGSGSAGVIQTSPDGTNWTARTCPSRATQLYSVTFNSDLSLWCAGGINVDGSGCVITSSDGLTWTYGIDVNAPVMQLATFPVTFPSGSYTTYCYDFSCHLWITDDAGGVWRESNQSPILIGNDWPDLYVPWVDGDYQSMLSCTLEAFGPTSVYDDTIKADVILDDGVMSLSLGEGRLGTWSLASPRPGTVNFATGAISQNANDVLLNPNDGVSVGMLLSVDGGVTFNEVATSFGVRTWMSSCFAAFSIGVKIAYAVSVGNHISKSTDGGLTWTDLPNSPTNNGSAFAIGRIRCTSDGQTVIFATIDVGTNINSVYVSRDGGATWVLSKSGPTDPTAAGIGNPDCGLSMDGSVMFCCFPDPGAVFISTDTGATWTTATAPAPTGFTSNLGICPGAGNVSPDGNAFIVAYLVDVNANFLNFQIYATNISLDGGVTWSTTYIPDQDDPNACYIVPAVPVPPIPPTPTPTPTPETCVIADTDTFDYIFAFPDRGAFLRDTIVGSYASRALDLLIYNPVETALKLPFFYPRTTPTTPIPPTVPPGVPDVITPPVPVVGNPTVLIPQLADSSLYLPTYWAMVSAKGPVIAALYNHPNLVLVNDRTLMFANQCSVVKTIVDVSHINIVFSNFGVYVYDGLCVTPCVLQTLQ